MVRVARILCAALLLALAGSAGAADAPTLAGSWKIFVETGDAKPWWLLKLEEKDGKWTGAAKPADRVPPGTIKDVIPGKEVTKFTLVTEKGPIAFELKMPATLGDRVLGTIQIQGNFVPVRLERTTVASLEPYELDKEFVQRTAPGADPDLVDKAVGLIDKAGENKAKPEEVRAWADKAVKTAEMYGPGWHRQIVLSVAQKLAQQDGFAKIAVTYARQAERMLDPKEKKTTYNKVLETLAVALEKDGKADDAKEVRGRLKKTNLEKPEPFAGRKAKSDSVVLVELFSGSHCPPCVAADLAFEALGKAYKPSEVILLQYHEHFVKPDPLANLDGLSRMRFYGDLVRGAPTLLLNGKEGPEVGGAVEAGSKNYDELTEAIDPLLEKPAGAKIKLTATQKDKKIEITAKVSDAVKTGNEIHLRLVLVEEAVNYSGANKLPVHYNVVRAFAGDTVGTVVSEKTLKKSATIDLDEVRKTTNEYLDKLAEKVPFPDKERPLELKKLKVVAFIQDDDGGEILQAAQVDVK